MHLSASGFHFFPRFVIRLCPVWFSEPRDGEDVAGYASRLQRRSSALTACLGLAAFISTVLMLAAPPATAQCTNIAGNWTASESGTLTLALTASDGESDTETEPVSGSGVVTITQTGTCTFQYIPIGLNGVALLNPASAARTVTVNGSSVQITGIFAEINYAAAEQEGITITSVNPNVYSGTGQVTTNPTTGA